MLTYILHRCPASTDLWLRFTPSKDGQTVQVEGQQHRKTLWTRELSSSGARELWADMRKIGWEKW
jgi:hypothetical protein